MFPPTTAEAAKSVVPLAAMVKPLQRNPAMRSLEYEPVTCNNAKCHCILNPYCFVDMQAKVWHCRLCFNKNLLPAGYMEMNAENLPAELQQDATTVEYILPKVAQVAPIFLYVIDTCLEPEDLQALKDSILVSFSLLPRNALIGIITYGTMVHVHELGFTECMKSIVLNGSKEYTSSQIQEQLGLLTMDLRPSATSFTNPHANAATLRAAAKYVLPVQEVEFDATNLIEQLLQNSYKVPHDKRPRRATGTALNAAISLLEGAFMNNSSTMLLFTGGSSTVGPGTIVDPALKEPLRSHHDVDANNQVARHYKSACRYYEKLAKRSTACGCVVDIFAGCYDQVGLDEMHYLPQTTGGVMVLSDSFTTSIFKQSFMRLFNTDPQGFLEMAFLGTLTVRTSKELKVSGLIGHAHGLGIKGPQVAETEIGIGGTNQWKLCGIRPSSTYAVFFDVASSSPPTVLGNEGPPNGFIQLTTYYLHSSGVYHLRVTTIARPFFIPLLGNGPAFEASFDQEAVVAIIGRLAIDKADKGMPVADIIRWIDNLLIKMCARFAQFIKDDTSSFRLGPQMTYFPQFMYHLRRSQFLQVFNNSPDETIYYRHTYGQEDTTNSSIMIQPTLTSYEIDKEPTPVLLDVLSVTPDRILLLDTFFHLLIYHGETIAAWRKAGYQDLDEYENFRALLAEPRADAAELLIDRFPLPRFIDTEARGSQARFLFSRLNPSKNTGDRYAYTESGGRVLTDDVSLQDFMEYLIKLVVKMERK